MATASFDDSLFISGASFHVELPPIDARHMFHFSRRLLFFRCTSDAQRDAQLAAFKTGIQGLLVRCPILGGVVTTLPPDKATAAAGKEDWRTIVPGRGIELVVKDLRGKIPAFEELEATNFPPRHFPWALLMPIPEDPDLANHPHDACKLQFSAIDGGTILTFAMSHCVSDGTGTDQWIRILAEETKLAQEDSVQRSETTIVGLDRSFLCNIESDLPFNMDQHPAYMWKKEIVPASEDNNVFGVSQLEIPVLLRLSPAGLAQLKADATTSGEQISTHDALCALMWRTVLLLRSRRPSQKDTPSSTTTNLFMPTSARRHLPGLPSPYVGNAVYQLIAGLDIGPLLSPSGLQRAAAEIRRAISAITPELVASHAAFIRDPIASRLIEYQFMNGTIFTTSVAMGTCLGSGDIMYGSDWGKAFGPVVRFRLIGEPGNVVFPKRPDGSAELILDALPEEVEIVEGDEGFGKYLAL